MYRLNFHEMKNLSVTKRDIINIFLSDELLRCVVVACSILSTTFVSNPFHKYQRIKKV